MLKLALHRFALKSINVKLTNRPNTTIPTTTRTIPNTTNRSTSQLSLENELKDRNLISKITHEKALPMLQDGGEVVYFGIDPTESSLHLGHLLPIICIKHIVKFGNKAIIVLGGATVKIGDPSGRRNERSVLEQIKLDDNYNKMELNIKQILKALEIDNDVTIMNNFNWYKDMKLLDFYSRVGRNARIGVMLDKWSVRERMENNEGLSFQEFSYQLFQAYDFLHLFETQGCRFQLGGADQYGNITAGCDLVRKLTGKIVLGLTTPLLVNKRGVKIGKSDAPNYDNMWLSNVKSSPYIFYQNMLRLDDKTAPNILRQLSLQPLEIIEQLISKHNESPHLRIPQKQLANDLTLLIYGEKGLKIADIGTRLSFESLAYLYDLTKCEMDELLEALPHIKLQVQTDKKLSIEDVILMSGHANSPGQAKTLLVSSFRMNGIILKGINIEFDYKKHLLKECLTLMRSGKKVTFIWWTGGAEVTDECTTTNVN